MAWEGRSPNRTRGRRWMTIRARIIARDKVCQECKRQRTLTRDSSIVAIDHIVPLSRGGTDDDSNLEGLCKVHHDRKTQAEAGGGRLRRRTPIGSDGWPTDR